MSITVTIDGICRRIHGVLTEGMCSCMPGECVVKAAMSEEGGVNESSSSRRSADVTSEDRPRTDDSSSTSPPAEIAEALHEFRKGLKCLALEVPEAVWRDFNERSWALINGAVTTIEKLKRKANWPEDVHKEYLRALEERDALQAELDADAEEMEDYARLHGLAALLDHIGLDGLGNEVSALRRIALAASKVEASMSEEHSGFDNEGYYSRYTRYNGEEDLADALREYAKIRS